MPFVDMQKDTITVSLRTLEELLGTYRGAYGFCRYATKTKARNSDYVQSLNDHNATDVITKLLCN
ncbi:hypothetical protein BELL_1569g00010 [Botrytis elliptica]|uniref:Uncharacterized protein n=1 Tax=Botrytis elliptica TaxID=278938 RepID=A0A4Z1HXE2_9HELO|nr:hypothetical protein BELL_1569g00010 [Botrytis elliptica]